jgi:hypothetical protein
MPEDSAACSGPSLGQRRVHSHGLRARGSLTARAETLYLTIGMYIALTKVDGNFQANRRTWQRQSQLSANPELVEGAPVTALLPRIQPHGTTGEIPDFALDFVHWVCQTSVV